MCFRHPSRALAMVKSPKTSLPTKVAGRLIAVLAAAWMLIGSASALAQGAETANPRLPKVSVQAGIHIIRAEVAADVGTRAKGLMHREQLGPNEGMLFAFERKAQHCFWMRNTPLPLSIAFIDDDGTLVNIENMTPKSDESHCPLKAVRFALEMEQGWFAKKGVVVGSKLSAKGFFPGKP
jgi:uncharacterized protein